MKNKTYLLVRDDKENDDDSHIGLITGSFTGQGTPETIKMAVKIEQAVGDHLDVNESVVYVLMEHSSDDYPGALEASVQYNQDGDVCKEKFTLYPMESY